MNRYNSTRCISLLLGIFIGATITYIITSELYPRRQQLYSYVGKDDSEAEQIHQQQTV
jgi:hypothetical protein